MHLQLSKLALLTFELYQGTPIFDVLALHKGKEVPVANQRILCRHPFEETKRAYVTPSKVIPLLQLVWDGSNGGIQIDLPSLAVVKERVKANIKVMRPDHLRPLNPTPYKVSVTRFVDSLTTKTNSKSSYHSLVSSTTLSIHFG